MLDIATIAQSVAIISACWTIIAGIGAWKREFIGKRQIELAEQTLAKFFEIKDALTYIRNPFSNNEEGKTRKRDDRETEEDAELLDRGYVVVERYGKKETAFAEFNLLKYRFMATFGADKEPIFIDTYKTVNSIFHSARLLATHYWKRQGRVQMEENEFQRHLDQMNKHEGILWDSGSEDDEIQIQLQSIHARLEAATKHCFQEPVASYAWFTKKWFSS